ncbi:MAG: hypothetical protein HY927_11435 [Elusimicrobia bacterium]|nr:hypothetical protein [Elusimicrobiota bacterium]
MAKKIAGLLRWILRAGALLVVVAASAVLAGTAALEAFLPPEKLREMIVAHAEGSLDRDVRLRGLSLGLVQGLSVDGLEIAEEGGFDDGLLAAADRVRVKFRWLPLLQRRVVADTVSLDGARFHLKKSLEGRFNVGKRGPRPKTARKRRGPIRLPVEFDVRYVEVSGGRFTYENAQKRTGWDLSGIAIGASGLRVNRHFPVEVSLHAKRIMGGRQFEGDASAAGELDLADFDPVRMSARVASFEARLKSLSVAAAGSVRRFARPIYTADQATLFQHGVAVMKGSLSITSERNGDRKALAAVVAAETPALASRQLADLLRLPRRLPALPPARLRARLRLEKRDLEVKSLTAVLPGAKVSVEGRLDDLGPKLKPSLDVVASLDLPAFSSEDVGFLRGLPPGLTVAPSHLSASVRLGPAGILVRSLALDLESTRVELSGRLDYPRSGASRLRMKTDTIRLDLAEVGEVSPRTRRLGLSGTVEGSLSLSGSLGAPSVEGEVELKSLAGELKGIGVSDVSGGVSLADGGVSAPRLTGKLAGSRLEFRDVSVGGWRSGLRIALDGDLEKLDLERLLASRAAAISAKGERPRPGDGGPSAAAPHAKASRPMSLRGRLKVGEVTHRHFESKKLELRWDLGDVAAGLREIDGSAALDIDSGRFESLDALTGKSAIAKVLLMPLVIIQKVSRLPGLNLLPDLSKVEFSKIAGDYAFEEGVMTVKRCRLVSTLLVLDAQGKVDFHDDSVDLKVATRLLKMPVPLEFGVTGDYHRPKVRLNPAGSLLSPVKGLLNLFKNP